MATQRPFQLLIKPVGADCNLRCDYCFYLRAHEMYAEQGRHIMSDEVLEHVVSGLLRLRFPQSVFAWQGGEPTLAGVDFFRKVVELQQKHGVSGQAVGNGLQTNGVLIDDEWCRLFRDYSFLIGLSIDGPRDIHDQHRKNKAGVGFWDRSMAAADRMRRHRVEFNILCVVNAVNVKMGAGLLKWFVDEGFDFVQFIPCVEPGLDLSVDPEEYGAFLCDTFDYWSRELFGRVSLRDFDALVAMEMGEAVVPLCTYGRVCNHYILVEHNGDVFPCDFFAYPEWNLGNVMDAPLESCFNGEKYRAFSYQKDKVRACRGCKWRALCHGGCQKDRMPAGGLGEPSVLCPAYQRLFDHAMPRVRQLAKKAKRMCAQSEARQQQAGA